MVPINIYFYQKAANYINDFIFNISINILVLIILRLFICRNSINNREY